MTFVERITTRMHSYQFFSTHIHLREKNGMLHQNIGLALQKEVLSVATQCLISEKTESQKTLQSIT